jgi:sulfoxide reductase catalytic subunit YedY
MVLIKKKSDIASSDITSESTYVNRRQFIGGSILSGAALAISPQSFAADNNPLAPLNFTKVKKGSAGFYTDEALAPYDDIKRYNNFYEFGTGKEDPARYAESLTTDPWSFTVEGEVDKPGKYQLEDILKKVDLEERIYSFSCVDAWSMVIPWVGF